MLGFPKAVWVELLGNPVHVCVPKGSDVLITVEEVDEAGTRTLLMRAPLSQVPENVLMVRLVSTDKDGRPYR